MERPVLTINWRDFVFFHFTVDAARFASQIPYPVNEHDGRAFVSLVSFRVQRARPPGWPSSFERWLSRRFSDRQILEFHTYVRGPAGIGIHPLAAWADNRLSLRWGSALYGIPHRPAMVACQIMPGSGLQRISAWDRQLQRTAQLIAPANRGRPIADPQSDAQDVFLLDHRLAYTRRAEVRRWFAFRPAPWQATPFHLARFDAELLEVMYPWFKHARFVGGHLAPGWDRVAISCPHRIAPNSIQIASDPVPHFARPSPSPSG